MNAGSAGSVYEGSPYCFIVGLIIASIFSYFAIAPFETVVGKLPLAIRAYDVGHVQVDQ